MATNPHTVPAALSGDDFISRAARAAQSYAIAAGELIRDGISADRAVDDKGTNDVVTDMDKAADRLIIGRIREAFPECGVLTEESGDVATAGDTAASADSAASDEDPRAYTWVVDPIDGTTSYLHRHPCYSVSIAVHHRTRGFVVGCVFGPALSELFLAASGRGAFLNGSPISVSATTELQRSLVASGFPYDRRTEEDNNIATVSEVLMHCQGFRRNGSAAIDLCYVACGRHDAYWEVVLCPWDYGAGCVIVEEAGGKALCLNSGERPGITKVNTPVISSNGRPGVHDELVSIIARTRKARPHVDRS